MAATSAALPGMTFSVLENEGRCGRTPDASDSWAGLVVGKAETASAPRALPSWMPCAGHAGLVYVTDASGKSAEAIRAVVWLPGQARALVASLPVRADVLRLLSRRDGRVARVGDPGG